ncbi:MAG: hypothetical protein AAF515_20220 [Pseudomonadota bacterium]
MPDASVLGAVKALGGERRRRVLCAWLFAAASVADPVWAAADPDWLRNWNLAFIQRPEAPSSIGRIAAEEEPGVPMLIVGTILTPAGEPAGNVLVHAYHRDRDGFEFGYRDAELATWRLQGWAKTDELGRFWFRTIRPAADHLGREGAHVHFTVVSDTYGRQWAPTRFIESGEFDLTVDIELKEDADF